MKTNYRPRCVLCSPLKWPIDGCAACLYTLFCLLCRHRRHLKLKSPLFDWWWLFARFLRRDKVTSGHSMKYIVSLGTRVCVCVFIVLSSRPPPPSRELMAFDEHRMIDFISNRFSDWRAYEIYDARLDRVVAFIRIICVDFAWLTSATIVHYLHIPGHNWNVHPSTAQ